MVSHVQATMPWSWKKLSTVPPQMSEQLSRQSHHSFHLALPWINIWSQSMAKPIGNGKWHQQGGAGRKTISIKMDKHFAKKGRKTSGSWFFQSCGVRFVLLRNSRKLNKFRLEAKGSNRGTNRNLLSMIPIGYFWRLFLWGEGENFPRPSKR